MTAAATTTAVTLCFIIPITPSNTGTSNRELPIGSVFVAPNYVDNGVIFPLAQGKQKGPAIWKCICRTCISEAYELPTRGVWGGYRAALTSANAASVIKAGSGFGRPRS